MNINALACCLEQIAPGLQQLQQKGSYPGDTAQALYDRLCDRREGDSDIDMVCQLFERFGALDDQCMAEIVGVLEQHFMHIGFEHA